MKNKKKYYLKISNLKSEIMTDLLKELERVNRTFTVGNSDDESDLEFLTFKTVDDNEIKEILPDGTVKMHDDEIISSLRSMVDEELIPISDAVSIYESLLEL